MSLCVSSLNKISRGPCIHMYRNQSVCVCVKERETLALKAPQTKQQQRNYATSGTSIPCSFIIPQRQFWDHKTLTHHPRCGINNLWTNGTPLWWIPQAWHITSAPVSNGQGTSRVTPIRWPQSCWAFISFSLGDMSLFSVCHSYLSYMKPE